MKAEQPLFSSVSVPGESRYFHSPDKPVKPGQHALPAFVLPTQRIMEEKQLQRQHVLLGRLAVCECR